MKVFRGTACLVPEALLHYNKPLFFNCKVLTEGGEKQRELSQDVEQS